MRWVRGQRQERAVAFKSNCAQSFWSYLPLRDSWAAMRCCWSVLPLPKLNFMAKSDRDFVVACYDGNVDAVTFMLKSGQFDGNTSTSGQSALCAAAAGVRGGRLCGNHHDSAVGRKRRDVDFYTARDGSRRPSLTPPETRNRTRTSRPSWAGGARAC